MIEWESDYAGVEGIKIIIRVPYSERQADSSLCFFLTQHYNTPSFTKQSALNATAAVCCVSLHRCLRLVLMLLCKIDRDRLSSPILSFVNHTLVIIEFT